MSKTITNEEYVEIISSDFKIKNKLAGFDLDNTLIRTKSGKKFSEDSNDWEFNFNNVIDILKDYHDNNYCIIIISNQKNLKDNRLSDWVTKVKNIINKINLPIKVYASIKDNIYRKPNIGFWELIKQKINFVDSFYCGDAMGRRGDHADTDLKFALNIGLNFKAPETIFQEKFINIPKIKNYFDFQNFTKEENSYKLGEKEIIIMIGYPGSGKSTFVRKYLMKSNYEIINQDKLKSKKKCLTMCEDKMKNNYNIVIDNTNPDPETRKLYIDLGNKYNYTIRCFVMITSEEHSKHNNMYRFLYQEKEKVPDLVYRIYKKKHKAPELSEGFKDIVYIYPEIPSRTNDSKYYFYLY